MTKQTEALKMAIEAMERAEEVDWELNSLHVLNILQAIQACKEALALSEKQHTFPDKKQPAQKPVAWMNDIAFSMDKELLGTRSRIVPLYTNPAPTWQGLKIKEIWEIVEDIEDDDGINMEEFARAIEQALKEKNTCSS